LKIPYVGSGVIASALGMDKIFFKRLLTAHQLSVPKYEIFDMNNNFDKESERVIKILSLPLF
jgi:D-alanine-D-alanine ligase